MTKNEVRDLKNQNKKLLDANVKLQQEAEHWERLYYSLANHAAIEKKKGEGR